tara:strand:+ start:36 stop:239 length:204 start_codon:yes stop_codon:yes gene_type:complete
MNKDEILKKLTEDKTLKNELKNKGNNDLEVKIKVLEKEVDTLKTIIDLKDLEIAQLKEDAEDMLLYP